MDNQTPPYDTDAEHALVGAMLLHRQAIEDTAGFCSPEDLYLPVTRIVYATILDLWQTGQPVDVTTVTGALRASGNLDRVGGTAEVMGLIASGGFAANVKAYAGRVVRCAAYRKLIALTIDVQAQAFAQEAAPADLVDMLAAAATDIVTSEVVETPSDLWIMDEFLDRPASSRPRWVIPGLLRVGWRAMMVAPEGVGKALALDTPLPSPDGWTTMGNVKPGDRLFASDGSICSVTFATPVQLGRTCYSVEFSDGSKVVADADHLWVTQTCGDREAGRSGSIRTTAEIASTLRVRKINVANHSVPTCGPLRYESTELPIDPYILGVWLGDGASRRAMISTSDSEIIESFEDAGYLLTHRGKYDYSILGGERWDRSTSFASALRRLNLIQNKHIPQAYLSASVDDRTALLQGLMDSDGSVDLRGQCEFSVTSERLAAGTMELIVGLGHKATHNESAAKLNGREVSRRWRISFMPTVEAFRLTRKACRQVKASRRASTRYIVNVRSVESVPVRCVQVDSEDSTYLCGTSCIPTHNTVLFRQLGIAAAQGIHPLKFTPMEPCRTLIVDLENPDDSIVDVCTPIRRQVVGASTEYDPGRAWLWHRPGGINLRSRRDRSELESVLEHCRPDLVCLGPIYKSYQVEARESDEQAASEVMRVFDDLRTRHQFALMLEHHAPKGSGGTRDLMPYGSSLWLRWPEIGLKMQATGDGNEVMELGRWRGDRLENDWPDLIQRSTPWPWRGVWHGTDTRRDNPPF